MLDYIFISALSPLSPSGGEAWFAHFVNLPVIPPQQTSPSPFSPQQASPSPFSPSASQSLALFPSAGQSLALRERLGEGVIRVQSVELFSFRCD